jgi:hypothetical protein
MKTNYRESFLDNLYTFEGGLIQMIILIIFSMSVFFPFWINIYIPIILITPFHPTMFMIGAYCLSICNRGILYEVIHFFFSMMSIGTLLLFLIENYSAPNEDTRYNSTYCYPAAAGCGIALTKIQTNYSSDTIKEGRYDTAGMDMMIAWVLIFGVISMFNWIISFVSLADYRDSKQKLRGGKINSVSIPEDYICSSCTSNRSGDIVAITSISIIMFFVCFTEWIVGMYAYSISVIPLNPIYYNSTISAFMSIAVMYIPRSGKPVGKSYNDATPEGTQNQDTELLSEESEQRMRIIVPLEKKKYILLLFYTSIGVMELILNAIQMGTMDQWHNYNSAPDDIGELEILVNKPIYFGFPNDISIQYLPNTPVSTTLQSDEFSNLSYILYICSIINECLMILLIVVLLEYCICTNVEAKPNKQNTPSIPNEKRKLTYRFT